MSFEVQVPASSANLGPGFDSLAVALSLYLRVAIDTDGDPACSQGSPDLLGGEDLIAVGMAKAAEYCGCALPEVSMSVDSQIPVARGLGSSAAALVAGLQIGALLAAGTELGTADLIDLGGSIEGHADNIAAAVLGGVTAAISTDTGYRAARIASELPWRLVLYVPELAAFTHDARNVLPTTVPLADASANVGRTALLVKAIRDADSDLLGWAMDDRLHQPYRAQLFPHLLPIIERARLAGAVGGCLSGAGPTVLLLVPEEMVGSVGRAVDTTAQEYGVPGMVKMPAIDRTGVVVRHGEQRSV